jgi:hypothetical protein
MFRDVGLSNGPPGARVAGFELDEIVHLVARLEAIGLQLENATEPVRVVLGTRTLQPGIPTGIILQPDSTLTHHRHSHSGGVILIQFEAQEDETGLLGMYPVDDAALIDPLHGVPGVKALLLEIAWVEINPQNAIHIPESLLSCVELVFNRLVTHRRPPLRSWVAYCCAIVEQLKRQPRAVAGHEVREAVAAQLHHLNLFPDPDLFETERGVERRLYRNHHLAELRGPQGTAIEDDDLQQRIDECELLDHEGKAFSTTGLASHRKMMHEILQAGGPDAERHIALRLWEQLFDVRKTAVGLGSQVRHHLEKHHGARVVELDELEVQDRLDEGDSEAARIFIDAPSSSKTPLIDCLPSDLRKKLDRLTLENERGDLTDPLIAILYGLASLDVLASGSESPVITLESESVNAGAARSLKLFAFLYGGVLRDVASRCDGSDGGRFVLDPELGIISNIEELFPALSDEEDDDDEEAASDVAWGTLRLKLTVSTSRTPLVRFRWDPHDAPGLVAFAWLVGRGGAQKRLEIGRLDEWCEHSFDAPWESASPAVESSDELVRMWNALAADHFQEWSMAGLTIEALDNYLDRWTPILRLAIDRYVPKGGPLPGLDEFLDRDTAAASDGRFVMLATHPLRLRWLRHHFANLSQHIVDSLAGQLRLNPENDRLFFSWIKRVSPHRQPPVLSPGGAVIATAVREVHLHEEFAVAPTGTHGSQDWLGAIDDASIDEFVATTRKFLEAFPWKTGGLSVLLLATSGAASTARKYVERIRRREFAGLDLELHVATTLLEHDQVTSALSILDSGDGRGRSLFPSFKLVLHQWEGADHTPLLHLDGRIDIALAPNLFGLHSAVLEETRQGSDRIGGRFDPWLDPATYFRATDANTINVSQVLLPPTPDPLLEEWSTLAVRRRRQAPVDVGDPSGTDFITLQVAFDRHELLFLRLHQIAHWVVTLDPFVGRDQIDALSDAPDIIVVKPGVGKNESNTLLVSSAAGRIWVTRQLAKRLVADFSVTEALSTVLADRLYDIGRNVAPGLMLRALGLGRSTEEILGLVFARYGVDHAAETLESDSGMEYWLSLDEYPNWFGGALSTRPDLLRVRLTRSGASTKLDLLVLESKFRRQVDAVASRRAAEQVLTGKRLFDAALQSDSDAPNDAKFWRRELLTAVSQASRRKSDPADLPSRRMLGTAPDEAALLEDLRSGSYEFVETRAVVCLTSWAGGEANASTAHPSLVETHHFGRVKILEMLSRIEAGLAPSDPVPAQRSEAQPDDRLAVIQTSETSEEMTGPAKLTTSVGGDAHTSVPLAWDAEAFQQHTADAPMKRGVSSQELEYIYGKLLGRLDQLKVDVTRPSSEPWQQGPGFCLYRVIPMPGVTVDRITGKMDDIKLALGLPAELNIRTYVDRGAVVIEVPKEDNDRYYVPAASLWARSKDDPDSLSVPIGEDIQGDVVELDFSSSETPHLLIAGQTGAGKSVALETILEGACRRKTAEELRLHLVDPKGTELTQFEGRAHTEGTIGWQPEDAIEMLQLGIVEMERRYGIFKTAKVRSLPDYNCGVDASDRLPWWMIVLDEYADLTSDPDDRRSIELALKRIAQKGRAAGIHLIVATQKPSAEVISTVIRSNLPAQIALRVKSATDSRIILEEAGAESLAGKGDAFFRTAKGLRRVQCGYV